MRYVRSLYGHVGFVLCSLLGSFIVLHFIFGPVIHFELMLVKGIRSVSRFFYFFYVAVQFFQHNLLKRLSLLHYIALCSFVKDQLTLFMLDISGISILFQLA